jgi:ribonuclease E
MSDHSPDRPVAPPGTLPGSPAGNLPESPAGSSPGNPRGDAGKSLDAVPEGSTGRQPVSSARRRRRGSRGGRSRNRTPEVAGDTADRAPAQPPPSPLTPRLDGIPKPKIGDSRPAPVQRLPEPAPADARTADALTRRRRRGGRGRGGASERRPEQLPMTDEEAPERRRGRERKGRPVGRYLMVVAVKPQATQMAVLEGRNLIELYVSRPADDITQIDGNIYLGRVQNVLPGMEAAFIDIGTPKNAVLYRGDVRFDRDEVDAGGGNGDGDGDAAQAKPLRGRTNGPARDARIEQLLKAGQTTLCQVTKNPIGTKGARLTQEVSIPGRFVVLIPNSDTYGISKRLTDDERKRLRKILDEIRPANHGLIVRTAAEGTTADELRRDVSRLLRQWEEIDAQARRSKAPALLYREPDMAVRVIREEFNRDYRGVIIDDHDLYVEVRDYVASISPELADRVEYASPSDSPLPVFERYHVHEQIHRALDRKVWLPSGGSLIIERTEALTVIDVNTGKNVGTSNLEETVFRNNLEAAEEIARQLRLRDIGGIIVIDFIDMEIVANRAEVTRVFREALARDKTRTQVFDISDLGLVEMTRKRISEGLVESLSETCPTCGGRGIVFDESLL